MYLKVRELLQQIHKITCEMSSE